jgi:hypothetical protein
MGRRATKGYRVSWTALDGQVKSWDFTNRDRAVYWLNVLILDLGLIDARLRVIR